MTSDVRTRAHDRRDDERAIREVYARWFGSMERGDVDGLLALLDDHFMLKSPSRPALADREALRRGLEALHAAATERIAYSVDEVQVVDGWAWARVSERTTIAPRDGSAPLSVSGMHLAILHRGADGAWRVARDVSSLDHPV